MSVPSLTTVMVFRRSYGRRYSDLPVDQIDRDGLLINCEGTFMRPTHYDLRPGDLVRWRQGERYAEATIAEVQRSATAVQVTLRGATLLPPDYFPY